MKPGPVGRMVGAARAAAVSAVLLSGIAGAQIQPPPGSTGPITLPPNIGKSPAPSSTPLPPAVDSPSAGTSRGGDLGNGPTLVWNQGGLLPLSRAQAPAAQYFVVCLVPAPASACAWPGSFNAAASAIPRREWRDPRTSMTSPGRYTYTYTVPAAWAGFLDRDLVLTVGACAARTQSSCAFSPPLQVYWSSRNIAITDMGSAAQSGSNGTNWNFTVTVLASNEGDAATPPLAAAAVIYEVLVDPAYGCLRDVNSSLLNGDDVAILRDGRLKDLAELPRDASGRRIGTDVVGIWREGMLSRSLVGDARGLAAGATAQPVAEFTVTGTWSASAPSPKRFVAFAKIDSGTMLREWNETDNVLAKCPGRAIFR